ncbi:MAG: thiamine pyrophosphate-dependent dehydrogenase E1 component subunit alpha [bacterium]|nr:thiamine pyrophosphate-dependent dehydrogenase E1 component subunit alpha [bacterium]
MIPDLPADRLTDYLRRMLVIRRFEEGLIELAGEYAVGHFHVYIGQEATGVPALAQLEPGDVGFTTHRNHGHLLARGTDPAAMFAEILGKETGTNRGKGGTLHIASVENGFPTTSAATGGCTPLATGAAFAFSRLGRDRVSVCLFGDGALEEGTFHESINIAALESLPVIYLCENNSLEALGQKANEYPSSTMAAAPLTDLAAAFKVPTITVDGTDTGAVHEAMATAVGRARGGGGPTFIEALTVRWPGSRPIWPQLLTGPTDLSYAWDPSAIPADYAVWHAEQDGLLRYVRELLSAGVLTSDEALAMDEQVKDQIERGVRFALDSPYPPVASALESVYA